MTRELFNKIVKEHKINLDHFDCVKATINSNYTFITVKFFLLEVCGGVRHECCPETFRLSISAILKREEELPEDYETGWQGERIWNILYNPQHK